MVPGGVVFFFLWMEKGINDAIKVLSMLDEDVDTFIARIVSRDNNNNTQH